MIKNATDVPLSQNPGTLPDVSGALLNWFQNMIFYKVIKTIVNFQVVETSNKILFRGVIQTFTAKQLMMKPEGQRAWSWYLLHAEPSLVLQPDEVVFYLGKQYRVKAQSDFTQYGYVSYELLLDYTGSGPS